MTSIRSICQVVLVSALAGLALAGCSSDPSDAAGASDPTTTTSPSTTTTAAPERGRFVLAGDSMMYDTSPGLAAALSADSATVVEMVLPKLSTPASRAQLGRALSEAPTDVVVVMVGVWEIRYTTSAGLGIEDLGWADGYRTEVLEPLVELTSDHGSHLVLVHEPPMRSEDATTPFATLASTWAELAADVPEVVTYAEAAEWLGEGSAYIETVALPDGTQERLRRTDGIHFCREGVVRMVHGIVGLIDDLADPAWDPVLVEGWEHGPWTERFTADECPPAEPPP